jgi:hypothetical protein
MAPTGAPTCPAAAPIAGADPSGCGVICRVMKREHENQDPTGMEAGSYGYIVHEATGGVFLSMKSDPTSVIRFCHGDELPVMHDADGQARDSYTYCPVWQAEKDRIFEGRARATRDPEPEEVSMGLADAIEGGSLGAEDPWASARRDLDVLAPPS